jgi:hypothetical protein
MSVIAERPGSWHTVDFEDQQFGGYSVSQLEMLLKDCKFLDLIERPELWRTGLPGLYCLECRLRRPFDRKNIPGYLTTPTHETVETEKVARNPTVPEGGGG